MPGKHRKQSPIHTEVAKRGGTGLAAAALSVTGLSTAVVTGTTAAVAPNVQLMALVSAANSTSQFFAGSSYYGTDWSQALLYGTQDVVPFYKGPDGIADAIHTANVGARQTGVTGSGWGAGQAGTAVGQLSQSDLNSIGLVILDNNTNRAGGGFWTTYYPFAPLLGTTADPTPTNLPGVTVLDVGYEYNINGDAPVDPFNPFALGNSLAAYAFGYGQESSALNITQEQTEGVDSVKPVLHEADGGTVTLEPGTHYVVKDGNVVQTYPATGTTTNPNNSTIYITVQTDNLPLTRPLRLIPGGDIIANAIDPVMTDLVDAGYNDGLGTTANPAIPANPTIPRPMKPFSSLGALDSLPDSAQQGATDGAETAFENIGNPANFITKPIGEIGKLPGLSSLTNLSQSNNSPATLGAKNGATQKTAATGSNSERPRPLKKAADDFNSSLKKFADSLHKKAPAAPKPADDTE